MASFNGIPLGAAKLCQDMATLVNNRQGSDVQFKVGGSASTQGSGETIYDESATVTLYAHSLILRCRSSYFADMLDKDEDWKENSKCVIYKPNISPTTFQDVLHYIYTGDIRAKNSKNIIKLITVANEIGLEEFAIECQAELIRIVECIFSNKDEGLMIDVISTYIIPALNFASSHSLSNFSQELLTVMLPHIPVIIEPPDIYTELVNKISSEALVNIIASDNLAMAERSIWNFALSWACHQTELSKTAVEARLNNPDDGEGSSDETLISDTQLSQLKEKLTPLLPVIRISLLELEDYTCMDNILIYFLPRRRFMEINRFFLNPDGMELLDARRKKTAEQKILSKVVVKSTTWDLLRKNIFETGGITGFLSSNDLKFELLFRASEHGFLASTFHQRCDNKGPTLVIVRSLDGHFFGGVNFNHWKSDSTYSSSVLNFLFALPDEHHRKDFAIFKIKDQASAKYSTYNFSNFGPYFGTGSDLRIAGSANTNQNSHSKLPTSYDGDGASNTALAGSHYFTVSDYEVFSVKSIFSNKGSTRERIPFDVVIRTYIIPALNLASSLSLSYFSQELLTIMLPHISAIIKSPDNYTEFVDKISSEALVKIIASDDLAMTERSIWDFALSWACHQTKLSKTAVEVRLNDDDEGSSDETLISNTQLSQLKEILTPLIPVIRFSLLDPEDYTCMDNILICFLPRRRFMEINRFFVNPDDKGWLDAPRKALSKIVVESTTWDLLRKNIFETGGITGCLSLNDLKFELLFRASEHGFIASNFHRRCDNKGPTIVIVKSSDGHLFGGVNFNHWKSDNSFSSSGLNFLFALPDGHHRKDSAMFRIKDQNSGQNSSRNITNWGPYFGAGSDLGIANSASTNQTSYSSLPTSYDGSGASDTALAGSSKFTVSDYEVFAISKLLWHI